MRPRTRRRHRGGPGDAPCPGTRGRWTGASRTGTLQDQAGQPVPNELVTLTADGVVYATFTDWDGEYRFYGTPAGPAPLAHITRELLVEVESPAGP